MNAQLVAAAVEQSTLVVVEAVVGRPSAECASVIQTLLPQKQPVVMLQHYNFKTIRKKIRKR